MCIMETHITSLQNRADTLRADLAALMEAIARLEEHDRSILTARYLAALGDLEYRLMELQVEALALRRRIEMAQARLNRGERLTASDLADIENEVAAELLAWRNTLQQKELDIAVAGQVLDSLMVIPAAEVQRVKSAYRKLARLLHPDASPENAALFDMHWANVQQAYLTMDADLLEAILHVVEHAAGKIAVTDTAETVERLQVLVAEQAQRLAQLRANPPFCYAALLDNADWVAGKRAELERAIIQEAERLAALVSRYAEIKSGMEKGS